MTSNIRQFVWRKGGRFVWLCSLVKQADFGLATLIRGSPFGGRFALPRAERAVEGIRILVTEEKCCFSNFD
jgi:hypothetical protein